MKRVVYLLIVLIARGSLMAEAQSFAVAHDSVHYTYPGTGTVNVYDSIYSYANAGDTPMSLEWKVVATDFPNDWKANTGICDNRSYYNVVGIWPAGAPIYSGNYAHGWGDFHLQLNLATAVASGTHYITLRLSNYNAPSDSSTVTFIVTRPPLSAPNVVKSAENVTLYPNPARDEINVLYDAAADVKSIAVYNIIGRVVAVYKVTDNSSANLNLGNIQSGVYIARLINGNGEVVATQKFTRQ